MITISFLYKCRRCGAIECNPHTGMEPGSMKGVLYLLGAISGTPPKESTQAPTMYSIHTCAPDAHGIADLIGYEPKE